MKTTVGALVAVLTLLPVPVAVRAQSIYRCVDPSGNVASEPARHRPEDAAASSPSALPTHPSRRPHRCQGRPSKSNRKRAMTTIGRTPRR